MDETKLNNLRKFYRYAIVHWMQATDFNMSQRWYACAERLARRLRIEESAHRAHV